VDECPEGVAASSERPADELYYITEPITIQKGVKQHEKTNAGCKSNNFSLNLTPPMTAIVPSPDSILMVLPNSKIESQMSRALFTVLATL
jgi:hypothetical protein